jgi:hypothetical protein
MPIYTTQENVARVLRAVAGGKVRFSDTALTSVDVRDSNNDPQFQTTVDQGGVSVDTAFEGQKKLKFDFTSATTFNVLDVDTKQRHTILIGTGTIGAGFTTPDSDVTIDAGTFAGTIATGDSILLTFEAHISQDDVDAFIEESEVEVDTILSESGYGYLDLVNFATRLFESSSDVPPAVSVATTYLAAYYIYSNVFVLKFKSDDDAETSFANRWKNRAEKILARFIKGSNRSMPAVLSLPSYVDKFGVRGVYPGTDGVKETENDILRAAHSDYIADGEYVGSVSSIVSGE